MPIVNIKHISDHVTYGMWKIKENVDFLHRKAYLSSYEQAEYVKIQNIKRKKEWLSARVTLSSICTSLNIKYNGIIKDESNKPHLIGVPWHISISHSFPYAAALINTTGPCGIDIEMAKPSLFNISKRFLNEEELKQIPRDPMYLCSAWAAKEVLFKIYGRKSLSFKNNLFLSPYELKKEGQIQGHIKMEMGTEDYLLQYFQLDGFIVCYSK